MAHEHVWDEGEVRCYPRGKPELAVNHPAVVCDGCDTLVDLTCEEDPR